LKKCYAPSLVIVGEKPKMKEYILFQEVYHNLVGIEFTCYSLTPFRDVVNCHEDILVSMRHREGTHEVNAPNIENFDN